jgi:hypothetical protein
MKRLLFAVCFVFLIPFLSFADEVDKGLPGDTPSLIKESVRQVIDLGVEPNAVIKMTQSMIADGFSERQIITGHELLIKAKKQNLAEEPIINKLHEGIAKNVGAEDILQAMEKVRARYELANTYAQNLKTDEEQARVMAKQMAECMAAGMDKGSMNKITEMLQQKTKNSSKDEALKLNEKTFETARTMARSGVDSKDIVDVMSSAFKRNYNAGEMEKLGNTFTAQSRGSSSASALARAYSDAIRNGAPPDKLVSYSPSMLPPEGGFTGGGSPPPSGGIARGAPPPAGGGTPPPGGSGISAGTSGAQISPASAPPGGAPGGERK